jgi:hypothetical protein
LFATGAALWALALAPGLARYRWDAPASSSKIRRATARSMAPTRAA